MKQTALINTAIASLIALGSIAGSAVAADTTAPQEKCFGVA